MNLIVVAQPGIRAIEDGSPTIGPASA